MGLGVLLNLLGMTLNPPVAPAGPELIHVHPGHIGGGDIIGSYNGGCRLETVTVYDTVYVETIEQVCSNKLESVCTNVDSKECRPVDRQECTRVSVPRCRIETRQECRNEIQTVTETVTSTQCQTTNVQTTSEAAGTNDCEYQWVEDPAGGKVWAPIPGTCQRRKTTVTKPVKECRQTPTQVVKKVNRPVCTSVPNKVCTNEEKNECRTLRQEQCTVVPQKECRQVPQKVCQDVHKKVPQKQARQVQQEVCNNNEVDSVLVQQQQFQQEQHIQPVSQVQQTTTVVGANHNGAPIISSAPAPVEDGVGYSAEPVDPESNFINVRRRAGLISAPLDDGSGVKFTS